MVEAKTIERTYTIPIRREWLKAPKYKRAKRAVSAMRTFLVRHMKSEDIRLGTSINLELWKHGMKCPPGKIKVNVTKDDKGVVRAELFGSNDTKAPMKDKRADAKKEAAKGTPANPVKTEPSKTAPAAKVEANPVAPIAKPAPTKEVPKPAPKAEAKKPEVKKI